MFKWLEWAKTGPFQESITDAHKRARHGSVMASLKWQIHVYTEMGHATAGSWQALHGREMVRLKWAIYGWLTASLKWQRNGSPEVGHLRLAHGKP